ncbi:MAG TPA: hypothetical protein VHX38_31360 [Pseudonocardiaceae bacterium]|nr:hypothetical protein [Pseudonocardiaceae bacterium]
MAKSPQDSRKIVVEPGEVPFVLESAAAHDVTVHRDQLRGIEPVSTVILTLFGVVTAVSTVQHLLEQRRGGQLIDLRPGAEVLFRRTRDLMYGIVVVIAVDGKVTVEVKEPEGMFGKVIATLPRLLPTGGSAQQVVRTVSGTFGSDVSVAETKDDGT